MYVTVLYINLDNMFPFYLINLAISSITSIAMHSSKLVGFLYVSPSFYAIITRSVARFSSDGKHRSFNYSMVLMLCLQVIDQCARKCLGVYCHMVYAGLWLYGSHVSDNSVQNLTNSIHFA